jgi:CBS domain containing-hemolysin-like protein
VLSAYFAATEIAYAGLNKVRLKNMVNNGNKRAAKALALMDKYDSLLSTVLIGNSIVTIAAASIATIIFVLHFGDKGVAISTITMTVIILIFGEIIPKSLAKEMPESWAVGSAAFLRFFMILLWPITFIFGLIQRLFAKILKTNERPSTSEDELMIIVDEAEAEGGIGPLEGELIRSAIEFTDSDVEDILTPRVDIVSVDAGMSMDEIEKIFVENHFSRLPVCDGSLDKVIGVIHEKDFFAQRHYGKNSIEDIIKDIIYTPTTMKISALLRLLQSSKSHLAIVVDEFGGTAGIVTLEDILEELVGEIWDEHDEIITSFDHIEDGKYIISGSANLEEMFELLNIDTNSFEEEYDAVSVGGWVVEEMGKIPAVSEIFTFNNLLVTVTKADEKKIEEIQVDILPEEEAIL